MQLNLGLDEALVTVNKTEIGAKPVEVYYQIDECSGCPLDKLNKTLGSNVDSFVIGTKYKLQMELRNAPNGSRLCKLDDLALNNHGHYKLDILANADNGSSHCRLQTLEKGDCNLCPLTLLVCLIFALTLAEKLYSRFMTNARLREMKQMGDISNLNEEDSSSAGEQQVEQERQKQKEGQSSEPRDMEQGPSDHRTDPPTALASAGEDQLQQRRSSSSRVDSLDAFRGLTIAGMIMANYGGAGYSILEHKHWDGITVADFVFPFFIFSMGASVAISTRSMVKRGKTFGQLFDKILKRSLILILLGICLNSRALEGRSLTYLRLTGVLQRFSISYLVVALLYGFELTINKWLKAQSAGYWVPFLTRIMGVFEILTAFDQLIVYLYVSFFFEYDSKCPVGYTGPGGETDGGRFVNCTGGAAGWLDRTVLGENHLYNDNELKQLYKTQQTHDPEGLLGYSTSILLAIIGLQSGKILVKFKNHRTRLIMFSQWILLLTVATCLVAYFIPINKRLWSLSFILVTALAAYLLVTLLYISMDVYKCQRTILLRLLVSAGKNSIFLYVGHSLVHGMLPWFFSVDESSHLQLLLRLSWATLVWLLIAHYMASKRLFIKI